MNDQNIKNSVGASVVKEDELETMRLINDLLLSFEINTRARILNWVIDKNGLRIFNRNNSKQEQNPIDVLKNSK